MLDCNLEYETREGNECPECHEINGHALTCNRASCVMRDEVFEDYEGSDSGIDTRAQPTKSLNLRDITKGHMVNCGCGACWELRELIEDSLGE